MPRRKRHTENPLPAGVYCAQFRDIAEVERTEIPWSESELADKKQAWEDSAHERGQRSGRDNPIYVGTWKPKPRYLLEPKWKWTFRVFPDNGPETDVTKTTRQRFSGKRPVSPERWSKLSRKNKLYFSTESKPFRWVEAILGRPLEPDDEFEWEDLVGCWCKVTLITKRGRNKIEDVSPRDWE